MPNPQDVIDALEQQRNHAIGREVALLAEIAHLRRVLAERGARVQELEAERERRSAAGAGDHSQ
jgi:hypothetical protein